jgi:formamidopyrimidine-DNA glycosylase
MPELPEVETTKRGIETQISHQPIKQLIVRHRQLRWPVEQQLIDQLPGLVINRVQRRAKYLLLETDAGTLIIHLGMSGHLRILPASVEPKKHDHIDLVFENGTLLRYHDPRRFGAWLWTEQPIEQHSLLTKLAPEPLSDAFNANYLFDKIRLKTTAIKALIMNNQYVVGVGNIYANESLFLSGLHPLRPGKSLSLHECETLVQNIRKVLSEAIEQGGTTLKDFLTPTGKPGYFEQKLFVYGRDNQPCLHCGTLITRQVDFQRASYVCSSCQPLEKPSE